MIFVNAFKGWLLNKLAFYCFPHFLKINIEFYLCSMTYPANDWKIQRGNTFFLSLTTPTLFDFDPFFIFVYKYKKTVILFSDLRICFPVLRK